MNLTSATPSRRTQSNDVTAQKVVIVNGGNEVPELLDTVLDAGSYDVVFVEAIAHAYSQTQTRSAAARNPLRAYGRCGRLPGVIDAEARRRNTKHPGPDLHHRRWNEPEEEEPELPEDEIFTVKPALQMH